MGIKKNFIAKNGIDTPGKINNVNLTAPANAATLTLADGSSLITSGAFSTTLTTTANTTVTLPVSGTLATTAAATTAAAGLVQLNDTVTSTSTSLAATANAAKTAYDFANTANINAANASFLTAGTVSSARLPAFTGDATSSAGTSALTLANTTVIAGNYGSASVVPTFSVDSKGRITAAANTNISVAVGSVTGLGTGVSTFLATPSSANLITAVTDETGTGSLVFATSPTLVTPTLGAATATSVNKVTITAPATSATLTLANGSSLITSGTFSTTLTATGTTSVTLPTSGTLATTAAATTAAAGLVQLNDTVTSTSTSLAATANTVKTAYDLAATKLNSSGGTISGDLTISGNVIVNGTTTTINATTLQVADNIVELRKGNGLAAADGGIQVNLTSDLSGNITSSRSFKWTNASNRFQLTNDGTNYSNVAVASDKLSTFASTTSAELASVISDETGSGSLVFATSPTLVTPNIGTPSAGTLTNCTGLPVSTGISGLGTGVSTFLATPSSENLIAVVADETGTGSLVFATSPTLVTPTINTSISTTTTSFDIANTTATTVNIGGAATSINMGAATGTTTVRNSLDVRGSVSLAHSVISSSSSTINTNNTTIDIDTISASVYGSVEYLIQVRRSTGSPEYNMTKLNIVHDGASVYIMETNQVYKSVQLGTFDVNLVGGNIVLQYSGYGDATTNNIVVKVVRTAITI